MTSAWVFDAPHYDRLNESRRVWLDHLLAGLSVRSDLRTALDAGCGMGFFSAHLLRSGLEVSGFDARADTIAEARRRHAGIAFHVGDAEDVRIRELGRFDCVLCFGLLYHLENPFLAVRNLHALAGKILIIESMITPGPAPVATLMIEAQGEDQGLHHIAFVPSESSLLKILYHAGFPNVYMTTTLPDHEDFRESLLRRRRRTMLVGSRVPLRSPLLQPAPEPHPRRPDIWRRGIAYLLRATG